MPTPHEREQALFTLAVSKPAAERIAFLDRECAGDVSLRQRLEALLAVHEQSDQFLEGQTEAAQPTMKLDFADEPADTSVGLTIGRYKLLEKVGEGGWGVVYVAEQVEPVRRRVALKVIKLGMDTKAVVARFEAERQALAIMDHPNIAKVLDAGSTEHGRPYFVMELVRGIKITDYCDKHQLDTQARLYLFIAVCQAVQHAHQKGIIHRDLKPSNILVTVHDGVPVPKVIDFGIAKATEGRLTEATVYTQLHQFIGTPAYMSPEQAEMSGLDIDTRSDIYSLGVLLYELLTANTPFDPKELMASGIDAMRKTIREKEPVRPSTRLAALQEEDLTTTAKSRSADSSKLIHLLRGDLDWIVMKCLEKDRTRRYETANGLAADLKRHLDNEPVVARPPSTKYRLQKTIRRNRLVFAAGAVVAVALVGGLGLAAAGWRRALTERNSALAARAGEEAQRHTAQKAQAGEAELRQRAQTDELAARRRAYASDMIRIQEELSRGNLRRARVLLSRHYPKNGETDLRGWEWRHLWHRCRGDALFKLWQDASPMAYAAFGAEPNRIIMRGWEGVITCWDSASRSEVFQLQGPTQPIKGRFDFVRPRLSTDGAFLAAPEWTNTHSVVRVWDTTSRKMVAELAFGEASQINAVAFSPDGKFLAVFEVSEGVTVWSTQSASRIAKIPISMNGPVSWGDIAFSPDGKLLAIGDVTGQVRVIDFGDFRERFSFKASTSSGGGIIALAFSPDGRMLAAGCAFEDPDITLWDSKNGKNLATLKGHRGFVSCLAFSPDGAMLASGSGDAVIKLWNTLSWKEEATMNGHIDEIWSIGFSRDGKRLVSAGKDGAVYVWPTNPSHSEHIVSAFPPDLKKVDAAPDGRTVAGIGINGGITLWDVSAGEVRKTSAQFGTNNAALFYATSGELLVCGQKPAVIKIYNPEEGSLVEYPLSWKEQDHFWFIPQKRMILAARIDPTAHGGVFQRWDSVSHRELRTIPAGRTFAIWNDLTAVAFSPDEPLFCTELGSTLAIKNLETGHAVCTIPFNQRNGIQGMCFIPKTNLLAGASVDASEIHVWNVTTQGEIAVLQGHNAVLASIASSPDGTRLVTATIGHEPIKLWDTKSWEEVANMECSDATMTVAKFLPDGNTLVAFDTKGNVHSWRAPSWDEIHATEAKERTEQTAK